MMDGLGRADFVKMLGGGLIALAFLMLLPITGFGSGDGHEPGVETARVLASQKGLLVPAAIAGGLGLVLLVISMVLARRG